MVAMRSRTIPLAILAAVLCTTLMPPAVHAGDDAEQVYREACEAAMALRREQRYLEEEEQWKKALRLAKAFGEDDFRYANCLGNLGRVQLTNRKYVEAEKTLVRALPLLEAAWAVYERGRAASDPRRAETCGRYAAALRAVGRVEEAGKLESK